MLLISNVIAMRIFAWSKVIYGTGNMRVHRWGYGNRGEACIKAVWLHLSVCTSYIFDFNASYIIAIGQACVRLRLTALAEKVRIIFKLLLDPSLHLLAP